MPLHHGGQHRYGPQMGQQGLPGTHRSSRMIGPPSGRPQDPYYDQSGLCWNEYIPSILVVH